MVLEKIYVVRHGYRSNWVVEPSTGQYTATVRSPTGIASDPALASYGVDQANQLCDKLTTLDPKPDVVYSSPFYRCLQTIKPTVEKLGLNREGKGVRVENGLGEFYGLARFDHPSPAPLDVLATHFPSMLSETYDAPLIIPSKSGESLSSLHNRIAYTMHRIIHTLDNEEGSPRALLICTHAASMIVIGRVLTGRMPEDENEEDFRCGTCALTVFSRKQEGILDAQRKKVVEVEMWDKDKPDRIPYNDWQNGKGVGGGWVCDVNGDCSFLSGGEERSWNFCLEKIWLEKKQIAAMQQQLEHSLCWQKSHHEDLPQNQKQDHSSREHN